MKIRVLLVVAGMLLMVVGCGKKEEQTVYSGPDGEVTVTQGENGKDGTVTMTGQDGTATMEYGKATLPADLNITLYPGASAVDGGTLQVHGEEGDADADDVLSVTVHSADAIDKVTQFYKKQLADQQPRVFEMALPTGKMVTFTMQQDGVVRTVVLNEDAQKAGTTIQISRVHE